MEYSDYESAQYNTHSSVMQHNHNNNNNLIDFHFSISLNFDVIIFTM